jgi:hypothetical protein
MITHADIRFYAASPDTAMARQVLFPIRVRVNRPSAEQALGEAKRVMEEFRRAATQVEIPGAHFAVSECAATGCKPEAEFAIEQVSKSEVRVRLTLAGLLSFEAAGDFWSRAAAIARVADFLQHFSQQAREKDIEVEAQQARLLPGKPSEPDVHAAPSV